MRAQGRERIFSPLPPHSSSLLYSGGETYEGENKSVRDFTHGRADNRYIWVWGMWFSSEVQELEGCQPTGATHRYRGNDRQKSGLGCQGRSQELETEMSPVQARVNIEIASNVQNGNRSWARQRLCSRDKWLR